MDFESAGGSVEATTRGLGGKNNTFSVGIGNFGSVIFSPGNQRLKKYSAIRGSKRAKIGGIRSRITVLYSCCRSFSKEPRLGRFCSQSYPFKSQSITLPSAHMRSYFALFFSRKYFDGVEGSS